MIRVHALYADRMGCGDYRVRFPVQAVNASSRKLGVIAEATDHIPADATFQGSECRIRRIDVPPGVKVVSFQRPMKAALAGAIGWLRANRPDIGIVVELDDDLLGTPRGNTAYELISPKYSPGENIKWLQKAIQSCDVLTVSTPELARRYSGLNYQTMVVRNGVPSTMLDQDARTMSRRPVDKKHPERIIGWAGYAGTHSGDLEVTGSALSDFVDGNSVKFRNIGPRDGVAAALGLQEDQIEASGWLKSDMYRIALGSVDIGIVPLADTRFNRSKSALKALEFAAAGVPVIASKLPEFEALRRQGMPLWLVKDRRREWAGAVKRLLALSDTELRDLSIAHREFTRQFGTVESHAEEWANAWTAAARAADLRTTRRAVAVS
jgi:glycosyltransferase involved in cell wall biosynthesis